MGAEQLASTAVGAGANAAGSMVANQVGNFSLDSLMNLIGSDGFKNIMQGGLGLYQGIQNKDMLDFQKQLATKTDARNDVLFQNQQDDRERNQNLKFSAI